MLFGVRLAAEKVFQQAETVSFIDIGVREKEGCAPWILCPTAICVRRKITYNDINNNNKNNHNNNHLHKRAQTRVF